jgi:hypothetical protein
MSERLALCAVGALALAAAAGPAGAVTFLSAGTSSACAAGSCFANSKTYTITWSAADFAGKPVGIQQLKLDRKVLGDMQDFAFKIGFQTADGGAVGDWGSYMIAGLAGDTVSIFGPGFMWDTHKGDLVLTLTLAIPDIGGAGGGNPVASVGGGDSSVTADAGVGMLHDVVDDGLLSGVVRAAGPSAVGAGAPEPQAWALMLLGFGAAGSLLRGRRRSEFNAG